MMIKSKFLAFVLLVTGTMLIVSCRNNDKQTSHHSSQETEMASVIDGVIIDQNIPAFKIIRIINSNLVEVVALNGKNDTLQTQILPDAKVEADFFEGNIVTMKFAKEDGKTRKAKFVENYDYVFTKFLKEVSGRWTSFSEDTMILYSDGKVRSNIKSNQYEAWHVAGQPSLRGINWIVLVKDGKAKTAHQDTVYINMERMYLNFGDEDDLALKYDGK